MTLPTPYYHDPDAGMTIYCGDCRDILPHLEPVDLVLKNGFTNSTMINILTSNTGGFNHGCKDERASTGGNGEKERSGAGSLGISENGNRMAILRPELVAGEDCELLQCVSNGFKQSLETDEGSITWTGETGESERALQGRNGKHALQDNDTEGQVLEVWLDGTPCNSSQERESSGQSFRKSASSLRELPQQNNKKTVVENEKVIIITDPPYGIKRDKGLGGFEGFGGFGTPIARRRFEDDDWDAERPDKDILQKIISMADISLIFGGNFFADLLPQGKHWIVWDKKNTMPTFGDAELIWTNIKRIYYDEGWVRASHYYGTTHKQKAISVGTGSSYKCS